MTFMDDQTQDQIADMVRAARTKPIWEEAVGKVKGLLLHDAGVWLSLHSTFPITVTWDKKDQAWWVQNLRSPEFETAITQSADTALAVWLACALDNLNSTWFEGEAEEMLSKLRIF